MIYVKVIFWYVCSSKGNYEIHSSSGTTGKPVVSGYTRKDLDTWATIMARGLTGMGLGDEDILQNTHGYGLFTGGFGVHYGAEKSELLYTYKYWSNKTSSEVMNDFDITGLYLHHLTVYIWRSCKRRRN